MGLTGIYLFIYLDNSFGIWLEESFFALKIMKLLFYLQNNGGNLDTPFFGKIVITTQIICDTL